MVKATTKKSVKKSAAKKSAAKKGSVKKSAPKKAVRKAVAKKKPIKKAAVKKSATKKSAAKKSSRKAATKKSGGKKVVRKPAARKPPAPPPSPPESLLTADGENETAGCGSRARCIARGIFLAPPVVFPRIALCGFCHAPFDKIVILNLETNLGSCWARHLGSLHETVLGKLIPDFVGGSSRFLHLLPCERTFMHPGTGGRRQISRLRRWVW